jgi:hypothetical protein
MANGLNYSLADIEGTAGGLPGDLPAEDLAALKKFFGFGNNNIAAHANALAASRPDITGPAPEIDVLPNEALPVGGPMPVGRRRPPPPPLTPGIRKPSPSGLEVDLMGQGGAKTTPRVQRPEASPRGATPKTPPEIDPSTVPDLMNQDQDNRGLTSLAAQAYEDFGKLLGGGVYAAGRGAKEHLVNPLVKESRDPLAQQIFRRATSLNPDYVKRMAPIKEDLTKGFEGLQNIATDPSVIARLIQILGGSSPQIPEERAAIPEDVRVSQAIPDRVPTTIDSAVDDIGLPVTPSPAQQGPGAGAVDINVAESPDLGQTGIDAIIDQLGLLGMETSNEILNAIIGMPEEIRGQIVDRINEMNESVGVGEGLEF